MLFLKSVKILKMSLNRKIADEELQLFQQIYQYRNDPSQKENSTTLRIFSASFSSAKSTYVVTAYPGSILFKMSFSIITHFVFLTK